MMTRIFSSCLLLSAVMHSAFAQAESWPAWRGDARGSGIAATAARPPLEWGKDKNVRWRVELPEPGNSTPIVYEDRVFVTQALTPTKWRGLMCFDRKDGRLLWKNGLVYEKDERTHRANPFCSASPVTDGELIVASFGSAGVAAYDFSGKQLWHRDLGPIDHIWGNSTSPVLHGDLCFHYHGPGKGAFLIALNKRNGETVWKWDEPNWQPGERTDGFKGQGDGVIGAFSTPILVTAGGREELVMSFPMELKAFDPQNGKVLWTCGGLNPLVYTSPIHADGIVVAMGGYSGNSIGVKTGGSGDVTQTHRLWQEVRHNGGIGTGVVKDGLYYYNTGGGIACCLDMKTGKTLWSERLPGAGKSWGSFILAGDLIYALSQAGDTVAFKADPAKLEVVAHSELGEQTNSSPVPVGDELFIRTHKALWCIGKK